MERLADGKRHTTPHDKRKAKRKGNLSQAERERRAIIKDYNQLLLTHDEVVEKLGANFRQSRAGTHTRNTTTVNSLTKLYQWIAARSLRFTAFIAKERPDVYRDLPKR